MPVDDRWTQFKIRVYTDTSAADAQRVVFTLRGKKSQSAMVVLSAGGELVVEYRAPEPAVPGFNRNDFVAKAGEMVRGWPKPKGLRTRTGKNKKGKNTDADHLEK
jgi:hypothetical protein